MLQPTERWIQVEINFRQDAVFHQNSRLDFCQNESSPILILDNKGNEERFTPRVISRSAFNTRWSHTALSPPTAHLCSSAALQLPGYSPTTVSSFCFGACSVGELFSLKKLRVIFLTLIKMTHFLKRFCASEMRPYQQAQEVCKASPRAHSISPNQY